MNKDNAPLYLPFVQALADGKTIQVYRRGHLGGEERYWFDYDTSLPLDAIDPSILRIKPEPRRVLVWWPKSSCNDLYSPRLTDNPTTAARWKRDEGGHIQEVICDE